MSELSKFDKFLLKGVKAVKDLYASIPKPKPSTDIADYVNKTQPFVVAVNGCSNELGRISTGLVHSGNFHPTGPMAMSGMVVIVSTGDGGRYITKEESDELARYRWQHMYTNRRV